MGNHFERYAEVAQILVRHGFGSVAARMGLGRLNLGSGPVRSEELSNPERLRRALEELGPTFIKLGQVLSTRPDMLPPDYLRELSKLQSSAPEVPAAIIRSLIEQELGETPEKLFASFSDAPLASASIGQAHAATLHDGTAVVIKVRRPGVVAAVQEDLEILQNLAQQVSRNWAAVADYNLEAISASFAATLRDELDYLQEGRNAERFAKNFADDPSIHIPKIYWATTTSRVLTIERIFGLKIDDEEVLAMPAAEKNILADLAAKAAVKMIFEDGFFHADPHPGNLFVESSSRIALIDFGMVGEVDKELRGHLGNLLLALSSNDADRIARALVELSINRPTTDRAKFRQDIRRFIKTYQGRPLGQIEISPLIEQILGIVRNHHLQLPSDIAMLTKMIFMTEGMGARLNPNFNLGTVVKPYASRLAFDRAIPHDFAHNLSQWGLDAAVLAADLPERFRSLVDHLDDGVEVHLRAAELAPLVARAERIGNRLVAGMIAAAFLRGIGELTAADQDKLRTWQNPLVAGGVGVVAALGGYLAWTSRRRPGAN